MRLNITFISVWPVWFKFQMIGVPSSSRGNHDTTTTSVSQTTIMNTKEKEKYIEDFEFPFCDEASKYEKIAKIGQGTFG